MTNKSYLLAVLFFLTTGITLFTACSGGGSEPEPEPEPVYNCTNNTAAYLRIEEGSTTYESGADCFGGTSLVTEDGVTKTIFNIAFVFNDASYNLIVDMGEEITEGSYTIGEDLNPIFIKANSGFPIKEITMNFDVLGELTAPFGDTRTYTESSGTFMGTYTHPDDGEISFSGSFCSDLEPE